jgi:hypothetical protein
MIPFRLSAAAEVQENESKGIGRIYENRTGDKRNK